MGTTANLALPYPEVTDTVDVPRDIQALAVKLDTTIPAGGGSGALGPIAQIPVLDVGQATQNRAGRQLAVADFTRLGLGTPAGLWNLGDLSNVGSDGRALTNKGVVPFGVGINGVATTAAVFAGSTAQALYIVDSGASDAFRIRTGSFGCWLRTAKRGTAQYAFAKANSPITQAVFWLSVNAGNFAQLQLSTTGTIDATVAGVSDIADDRWHFVVGVADGSQARLYVDGVLDASAPCGVLFAGSGPLNIGAYAADASIAAASPFYGRVDEAFITPDILTDDQVRLLYCARIAHTLGVAPTDTRVNVHRRRRGAALATTDFPAQPLRLYNFTAGALTDQGSNGQALTVNQGTGAIVSVAGADGTIGNAYSLAGAHTGLSATDAGLPSGVATRSYGCWFKTTTVALGCLVSWGAVVNSTDLRLLVAAGGVLNSTSGTDNIAGPFVAEGQWHHAVAVDDNAAGDGVRRKLYLDGRLVGSSTVLGSLTLGGANRFRVGAVLDSTAPFTGQIDGAFVATQALTQEQVAVLYQKSGQDLGVSPKNPGDHVEAMDASNVYATFDALESQSLVDLGVSA